MEEVLPPLAERPNRGRRRRLLAAVALVPVVAVAVFVVSAQTEVQDRPLPAVDADAEVARLARDYRAACVSTSLQEILAHPVLIPTHAHPLLGQPAPDFELADSDGKTRSLRDLRGGRPMILIFYYGYHCDHCVRQLFDVHRDLPLFREVGAQVAAVSADSAETTRQRFAKYGPFGFPVVSDPGNKVAQTYHVFRGELLRHGTFVIDREGTVRWANVGDAPFRRNPALLTQLAGSARQF